MSLKRHHINIRQRGETQFHLWRLTEEEDSRLRDNSLPIKEDGMFLMQLMLSERHNPDRLTLPKAFLALEHLFGETSHLFDDWKGSFSFPLLLAVKTAGQFFYLLRVYDHRGSLQFPLYRILENGVDGYDIHAYREPLEIEFSREEINEFICYFYGYLVGVAEIINELPKKSFLKRIDSNHILYGCQDGTFFEEQIDSEEDYKAAIQTFEETYGTSVQEEQVENLRSLLQRITGEGME